MRTVFVLAVLLGVLPGVLAAAEPVRGSGEPGVVGVRGLVERALSANPAVKAKKAEYEAARGKITGALLPEDPQFGVDVEGQSELFSSDSRMNREAMVMQTIPFPTKLLLAGVAAAKESRAAYERYKEEERAVVWRVEQPVWRLFLARRTLSALEENKALLDQFANVVKARYESNAASQSDYLKVQIELAKISIEIFEWRQKEHVAEVEISHQLNQSPGTHYEADPPAARLPFSLSFAELEKIALDKRPELKALGFTVDRARAERTLAKSEWLPDITGRIEARKFKGEDDIREYDNFIGVSVPVWSLLKGIGGGWRSADEAVRAAESLLIEMKNEVLHKVHEAYAKLESARYALETYENLILPQARQQVNVTLSSYEAGRTGALDLIDAERTLKNTQIAYAQAVSDYEMALSDLRLAAGDDLAMRPA